jgi:site-specific recombinase XerD
VDGENTAFSTGLDILPANWNANAGKATNDNSINKQIESIKSDIESHYQNMLETKGFVTAEMLKNALRGIGTHQNSVIQEFAAFLEEKKKNIGIRNTESTYTLYHLGFKQLQKYLRNKLQVDDIPFGKIDIAFIEDYVYYLKIDLQLAPMSVRSFLAPFRTVVRRAFHKGLMRQYPFFGYAHEKEVIKRRYLLGDELERLMKVNLECSSINFTRDMFLFSTFTGLSYSDLKGLQFKHIQQHTDDSCWIVLNRQKTGTSLYIPVLPVAQRILDKYVDEKFSERNGYVFKVKTIVNFNVHLKQIARIAKIDKRLTFHMSRHSYATTVCLNNGVPIESLSQMLGHTSIKTTQIYAQVTRTKINEDMTNLERRIEGQYKLAQ